ncbi:MAG: phage head morphogenesis protein [Firmicutes bacterium]|nr:phage head morphogenesis protein [Bacillota bacterium]
MEKRQREVQLELFNEEEMVKDRLKENYEAALKEVKNRIRQMSKDPEFRAKDIRHPKYLKMLEAQLETILHRLGSDNVRDMTGYLTDVYQEAFLGCLYKMHGDGVDLILMVDEDKVIRCINKETKEFRFDNRLYENVKQLKDTVKSELARGFSSGKGYEWMARQIALKTSASFSRAYTIARTEGHRVTSESEMDCMTAAKEKGADVIKEWTSTLDSVTRQTHAELDGQQRELEEEFEIPSSGARAMYPGGFGIAGEDVNCRCCMNQRARWNLASEEYRYSRAAGEVVSIKSDVYREWKERYNKIADFLVENAENSSAEENVHTFKGILQAISELPPKAQLKMLDVKYVIGGNENAADIRNRTIWLSSNAGTTEIFHEMGHLLEYDLFTEEEIRNLKWKYFVNVTVNDISPEIFYLADGITPRKVWLVHNNHLIDKYQGRIYVKSDREAFDADGNLKVDDMLEFMSVPISLYCTDPEELKRKDPEMFEFIRRHLK